MYLLSQAQQLDMGGSWALAPQWDQPTAEHRVQWAKQISPPSNCLFQALFLSLWWKPNQPHKNFWQKAQVSVFFCWGTNVSLQIHWRIINTDSPGCCSRLQSALSFTEGFVRAELSTPPLQCTWTLVYLQNKGTLSCFATMVLITEFH